VTGQNAQQTEFDVAQRQQDAIKVGGAASRVDHQRPVGQLGGGRQAASGASHHGGGPQRQFAW